MKLGGKGLALAGVLLLVMTAEAVALYFFFGPPPNATASAAPMAAGEVRSYENAGEQPDTVEVALEAFNCTNSRVSPGSVIHVSFQLVAIVSGRQEQGFKSAMDQHRGRIREAVLRVARSSSLEDLNDPTLSTLKRLIREEINKILRKSYVHEVVMSDFRTMEQ